MEHDEVSSYLFFSFLFLSLTSCGPSIGDRGCDSDLDCRFGRQCVDQVCVGEVDLRIDNNNPNNRTNNTNPNNTNTNNNTNNNNNNNLVTNNNTSNENNISVNCRDNFDCTDSQICTGQNECVTKDNASITDEVSDGDFCEYLWNWEPDNSARYTCKYDLNIGPDFANCQCEVNRGDENFIASFSGQFGGAACNDLAQIENVINANCGTRFRDTE